MYNIYSTVYLSLSFIICMSLSVHRGRVRERERNAPMSHHINSPTFFFHHSTLRHSQPQAHGETTGALGEPASAPSSSHLRRSAAARPRSKSPGSAGSNPNFHEDLPGAPTSGSHMSS